MSLGRRLERLEGRQGRRPDATTDEQHEALDRELERLLAEIVARDGADEAERLIAEVEAEFRGRAPDRPAQRSACAVLNKVDTAPPATFGSINGHPRRADFAHRGDGPAGGLLRPQSGVHAHESRFGGGGTCPHAPVDPGG